MSIQSIASSAKSLTTDDAIELPELLAGVLTDHQIAEILNIVHTKVDSHSTSTDGNSTKKQEHRYLDCYVPKQFGLVLMRKDVRTDIKAQGVAFWMKSMGLDKANEKTFSLAAAIASYIEPFELENILKLNRNIKTYFDALPQQAIGPLEYPESIDEFENDHDALFKTCFADSEPGPPLWSHPQRRMIWKLVPCRNTHTGCEQIAPKTARLTMPQTFVRSTSMPMLQNHSQSELNITYGGGTNVGEHVGMQLSQPPRRPQQFMLGYDPRQVPEQADRQPLQQPGADGQVQQPLQQPLQQSMMLGGGAEYVSLAKAQPDSKAPTPEQAKPSPATSSPPKVALTASPSLADITANIQNLAAKNSAAMKRPAAETKGGEDDKDDAGEDADEEGEDADEEGELAPSKKARTNQSSGSIKKPAAATTKPQSSKKIESPASSSKHASFEYVRPVKIKNPGSSTTSPSIQTPSTQNVG